MEKRRRRNAHLEKKKKVYPSHGLSGFGVWFEYQSWKRKLFFFYIIKDNRSFRRVYPFDSVSHGTSPKTVQYVV